MPFEIYDTATLVEVLNNQPDPPTTYWLDNFFARTVTFDTAQIIFDDLTNTRKLAPFVAPNVQGRVMRERGYSTKAFVPAYVKPKHVVTPQRAIARRAGESFISGSLSLMDRFNAIVANNLAEERDSILRREDWMACRALVDGFVIVAGDDYPSVTVDFGRDASLSYVLAGPAQWSAVATANPLRDISAARQNSFMQGRYPIDRLTFGLTAWNWFTQNQGVKDLLNTLYRGSATTFNTAPPAPGPYQRMGVLGGEGGTGALELWTYNDMYEDETGTFVPYLDQGTVVGTGAAINGIRCFGAIQDKRAGLVATEMFPKMWDMEDPSVTYTMTQSAPLMVPAVPNGSFKIKVV